MKGVRIKKKLCFHVSSLRSLLITTSFPLMNYQLSRSPLDKKEEVIFSMSIYQYVVILPFPSEPTPPFRWFYVDGRFTARMLSKIMRTRFAVRIALELLAMNWLAPHFAYHSRDDIPWHVTGMSSIVLAKKQNVNVHENRQLHMPIDNHQINGCNFS